MKEEGEKERKQEEKEVSLFFFFFTFEAEKKGGKKSSLTQILIVLSAEPEANHSFDTGSTAKERTQPRCPDTTR